MAEDQERKDEEKLEFDSAGLAVAGTLPDPARVLALLHARDNREFYGRPYRDLFNPMYRERSRQQEGITVVCGASRFVFV